MWLNRVKGRQISLLVQSQSPQGYQHSDLRWRIPALSLRFVCLLHLAV